MRVRRLRAAAMSAAMLGAVFERRGEGLDQRIGHPADQRGHRERRQRAPDSHRSTGRPRAASASASRRRAPSARGRAAARSPCPSTSVSVRAASRARRANTTRCTSAAASSAAPCDRARRAPAAAQSICVTGRDRARGTCARPMARARRSGNSAASAGERNPHRHVHALGGEAPLDRAAQLARGAGHQQAAEALALAARRLRRAVSSRQSSASSPFSRRHATASCPPVAQQPYLTALVVSSCSTSPSGVTWLRRQHRPRVPRSRPCGRPRGTA